MVKGREDSVGGAALPRVAAACLRASLPGRTNQLACPALPRTVCRWNMREKPNRPAQQFVHQGRIAGAPLATPPGSRPSSGGGGDRQGRMCGGRVSCALPLLLRLPCPHPTPPPLCPCPPPPPPPPFCRSPQPDQRPAVVDRGRQRPADGVGPAQRVGPRQVFGAGWEVSRVLAARRGGSRRVTSSAPQEGLCRGAQPAAMGSAGGPSPQRRGTAAGPAGGGVNRRPAAH